MVGLYARQAIPNNIRGLSFMISKDMTIGEAVDKYPESVEVFMQYGMGCLGCPATRFETIEQGANAHGVVVEDLVNDLNKAIAGK